MEIIPNYDYKGEKRRPTIKEKISYIYNYIYLHRKHYYWDTYFPKHHEKHCHKAMCDDS